MRVGFLFKNRLQKKTKALKLPLHTFLYLFPKYTHISSPEINNINSQ